MRTARVAALIFLLLAPSGAGLALAYTRSTTSATDPTPIAWDLTGAGGALTSVVAGEVVYRLHAAGSADVTDGSDLAAVDAAFQTWSGISGSSLRFRRGADASQPTTLNDGDLPVFWAEDSTVVGQGTTATDDDISVAGALAMTFVYRYSSGPQTGTIIDANIVFNGAEFQWTTTPETQSDRYDIQTVAVHEIGHALGLDHSPVAAAAMFPRIGAGRILGRSLADDDAAGLLAAYPGSAIAVSRGTAGGYLTASGSPVFGGLVWALDEAGRVAGSTISRISGWWQIEGLKPGLYDLHAQPASAASGFYLFSAANLGPYFGGLQREFLATSASGARVRAGTMARHDLATTAAGLPFAEIKLLSRLGRWSNIAVPVHRGESGISLGVAGPGLPVAGTPLSVSGTGVTVTGTYFGNVAGFPSVVVTVEVAPDAAVGPRDLIIDEPSGRTTAIGGVEVLHLASAGAPGEVASGAPGEPLLEARRAGEALDLWWEGAAAASSYRVYRGGLEALRGGSYDHQPIAGGCHLASTSAILPGEVLAGGLTYYLVTAVNDLGEGPPGATSSGAPRPAPPPSCP